MAKVINMSVETVVVCVLASFFTGALVSYIISESRK